MEPLLVYFSSKSRNTQRFIERVALPMLRIPLSVRDSVVLAARPFVLVCPTYAGDRGEGAVPKQVIRFLNVPENRSIMRGVIGSGNRNFGKYYAYAGSVISAKCDVPCLYRFELSGTPEDVTKVREGVKALWA
ncbi:MAG: class Ib ribonucleoside-diphosphate reductase assembly flavoprotein NrdI [Alphaproteobacteria bacterium]